MVESGDDGSEQQQIQPILVGNISPQQQVQPIDVGDVSARRPVQATFTANKSAQPNVQQNFVGNFSAQPQYIQLKYSPNPNYRNWAYGVIAIFLPISLYLLLNGDYSDFNIITGLSICCASPCIMALLDAIYLHGKSEWEAANEMPNNKTRREMTLVIVLGIIWTVFFIFGFIELLNHVVL